MELLENIERYGFYACDNVQLHEIKNELLEQIRNFSFAVTARGYFTFNRNMLAGVSFS